LRCYHTLQSRDCSSGAGDLRNLRNVQQTVGAGGAYGQLQNICMNVSASFHGALIASVIFTSISILSPVAAGCNQQFFSLMSWNRSRGRNCDGIISWGTAEHGTSARSQLLRLRLCQGNRDTVDNTKHVRRSLLYLPLVRQLKCGSNIVTRTRAGRPDAMKTIQAYSGDAVLALRSDPLELNRSGQMPFGERVCQAVAGRDALN
jgi:hypothetical protein